MIRYMTSNIVYISIFRMNDRPSPLPSIPNAIFYLYAVSLFHLYHNTTSPSPVTYMSTESVLPTTPRAPPAPPAPHLHPRTTSFQ